MEDVFFIKEKSNYDVPEVISYDFRIEDKKYENWPDIYEYFINMSLEEWINSCDLFKMYKYQLDNRLKLVKNEELSKNTKLEMEKISKWLGIDYNDTLIKSTYPNGMEWIPDS